MAGFKERIKNSLRLRLSVVLCSAIVIIALASGCFTFFSAQDEAHELQDSTLIQITQVLKKTTHSSADSSYVSPAIAGEDDANVIVQFIGRNIAQASSSFLHVPSSPPLSEGFQTLPSAQGDYRVLVTALSPDLQVAVGQKTSARDEVAFDSAMRTLMPFLILLLILLLVVADLVRKVFQPLSRLAKNVDQRDEQDLTPLAPEGIPIEVQPFVAGINRLLEKVEGAMETQRRFVADAAHELRSPLTALSLQAERLCHSPMSEEAQTRLATLQTGISRAKNLLEQLLSFARAQQLTPSKAALTDVSVQSVFLHVIEVFWPLAAEKDIDLGVSGTQDARLYTDEMVLFTLIKNLVENAVRYTPPGGRVDLRLCTQNGQVIIEVEDNGPGIAEDKRERVFDAFYRIEDSGQEGSGLGLSIVKSSVIRLGGEVSLHAASHFPTGLRVRLQFKDRHRLA